MKNLAHRGCDEKTCYVQRSVDPHVYRRVCSPPLRNVSMFILYARVSTQDLSLDLQTEALTRAGHQRVFEDKISGSRAERPGLTKPLEMLCEGDTLVVWKLDQLGRSVKNLVDLVSELHMASLAQMERELTVDRTRAGLEVARQLGRKGVESAR